jgi:hypothetical protein
MPYVSEAQRRYMHMKHPGIAKRWDREYGTPRNLPYHKKRKRGPLREAMGRSSR